jgi:hypothetical protein
VFSGSTTGKGTSWKLYNSDLVVVAQGTADVLTIPEISIDWDGFELRWASNGIESGPICKFQPNKDWLPYLNKFYTPPTPTAIPAVCPAWPNAYVEVRNSKGVFIHPIVSDVVRHIPDLPVRSDTTFELVNYEGTISEYIKYEPEYEKVNTKLYTHVGDVDDIQKPFKLHLRTDCGTLQFQSDMDP